MKTGCFEGIKLFLFDMDGTLYIGNRLFDFTEELLASIKRAGKRYLFITNNSSKSVSAPMSKSCKGSVFARQPMIFLPHRRRRLGI